jgi:hypothetical protein
MYSSYWRAWDYQRVVPIKAQQDFEEYIQRRKSQIHGKNQDWFEAVIGTEGYGKSQFALRKCHIWDPTFLDNIEDRIVYDVNHLERLFHEEEKGISILIDEAIFLAHSRSGFKQHVVRFVEDVVACRYLQDLIELCIPKLNSLDLYLRENRLRTVAWCKWPGKVWVYGNPNYRRIIDWEGRFRLPPNKRPKISPRADFRYYPSELTEKDELWKKYLKVKARRNKERYRKRNRGITTLTSGDIAKKYGVTEQTGRNYLKKLYEVKPEAIVVTPSGQLRLRKDEIDTLEALFPRKSG